VVWSKIHSVRSCCLAQTIPIRLPDQVADLGDRVVVGPLLPGLQVGEQGGGFGRQGLQQPVGGIAEMTLARAAEGRHAERFRGLGVVQAGPRAQREHVPLAAPQAAQRRVDARQPGGVIEAAG
jgi:hypothetical protein